MTREQVLLVLPVAAAIAGPLFMLALEKLASWMDRRDLPRLDPRE